MTNKVLALGILTMALAGSLVILMIPLLFRPTIPGYALPTLVGSAAVFVILRIGFLTVKRRTWKSPDSAV